MTTQISFDASRVGSDAFRRIVETALRDLRVDREEGMWDKLRALSLWSAGRLALLVSDLHQFTDSTEWEHWIGLPPSTFAVLIVRTQRDAKRLLRPDVALRINEGRLFVLDVRCSSRREAEEVGVVRGYFRAFISLLEPDRVLTARFSALDSILWIQFGDGLERAVRWSDLPFARELGLVPAAVSAGSGGESIVLVDVAGREIDVSASSLRAFFDGEYRGKLESEDDSERKMVGARIRAVRESASLSQQELSRRSGIAQESLSRIETGRRDPRLGTLQRLAKGLGLSLDQLMERLSATT